MNLHLKGTTFTFNEAESFKWIAVFKIPNRFQAKNFCVIIDD